MTSPAASVRRTAAPARRQRGSAASDLLSAIAIGTLALAAMFASLSFEVPGSTLTAPAMLPFLTGLTLLLMAASLGLRAVREGAWRKLASDAARLPIAALGAGQNRRTLLLVVLVVGYVAAPGTTGIELRVPLPAGVLPISGYEIFSFLTVTLMLKLFWRGPLLRCALISLLGVEAIAAVFRYGFGILMPASF